MEQGFPDVSSPDRQKQAQNSRAQLRLRNVKQTELSSSNHTRLINEKAQMGKLYYSRAGSSYFHFWWNSCGEPGVCAPSGGAKIYIARRNERFYQLKKERWRKRSTGLHFVLFWQLLHIHQLHAHDFTLTSAQQQGVCSVAAPADRIVYYKQNSQ